ncbi:helix-turn-helix domain-containing protein [Castellaniella sp.]|uniref:helix-turn-helix domain-containing protein n=1 Tax=Castellaniella sp. TaxID=1955812 RepID=UPI002AFE7423|nr:PAS domain-containing protein [Castellaniella sp.]
MRHNIGLIDFLGQVLGPDYGIALYQHTGTDFTAIAVSNGHICDCGLGATLPAALRLRLEQDASQASTRVTPMAHVTHQQKILRASIHPLHSPDGQLTGAICIYFDDSRYRNLSAQLLRLRHPDSFVDHYFEASPPHDPALSSIASASGTEALSPERILQKYLSPCALPAPGKLSTKERKALVGKLMEAGFFELKGAIPALAKSMACSPATVYRYVAGHKR